MQAAHFVPHKRKYLFIADSLGISVLQPMIEQAVQDNLPYEQFMFNEEMNHEAVQTDIIPWLSQQKMGTFLYIVGKWDLIQQIQQIAAQIGYSEEEMQRIGLGPKNIRVFCSRCHAITKTMDAIKLLHCSHCDLTIEISDHYSPHHQAFLGYVNQFKGDL